MPTKRNESQNKKQKTKDIRLKAIEKLIDEDIVTFSPRLKYFFIITGIVNFCQ